MDASPRSPSLGNILGKLLWSNPGGIREKDKSNKGLVGMELSQSGMPSGLPLVHLHLASVVELGGTCKMSISVRDRLSPTHNVSQKEKSCQYESAGTAFVFMKNRLRHSKNG